MDYYHIQYIRENLGPTCRTIQLSTKVQLQENKK